MYKCHNSKFSDSPDLCPVSYVFLKYIKYITHSFCVVLGNYLLFDRLTKKRGFFWYLDLHFNHLQRPFFRVWDLSLGRHPLPSAKELSSILCTYSCGHESSQLLLISNAFASPVLGNAFCWADSYFFTSLPAGRCRVRIEISKTSPLLSCVSFSFLCRRVESLTAKWSTLPVCLIGTCKESLSMFLSLEFPGSWYLLLGSENLVERREGTISLFLTYLQSQANSESWICVGPSQGSCPSSLWRSNSALYLWQILGRELPTLSWH